MKIHTLFILLLTILLMNLNLCVKNIIIENKEILILLFLIFLDLRNYR